MSDPPNVRIDGRSADQLRPVSMQLGYVEYPEGSVLIAMGNTRVLCNASVADKVPNWKRAQQVPGGWVTAEYSMLPRVTHTRMSRETSRPRDTRAGTGTHRAVCKNGRNKSRLCRVRAKSKPHHPCCHHNTHAVNLAMGLI